MALGILSIIFYVIIALTILLQFLLYKESKNAKSNNLIFMLNVFLALLISIMVFTSLPDNYIVLKIISLLSAGLAIVATVLRFKNNQSTIMAKVLLSIAVFGGLIQLLI